MITLYPKLTDFSSNVLSIKLSDSATLVLYLIDESFVYGSRVIGLDRVTIQYNGIVGEEVGGAQTVSIIGLTDTLIAIKTDYEELLGEPLSSENIDRVYLEVEVSGE